MFSCLTVDGHCLGEKSVPKRLREQKRKECFSDACFIFLPHAYGLKAEKNVPAVFSGDRKLAKGLVCCHLMGQNDRVCWCV